MLPSLATQYVRMASTPKYVPRAGDGCVLWLPGQDDAQSATIRDRSGKGNNGTITGATWGRLPRGLWYLDFDNVDDVVNCGHNASLALTGDMTFEFWVKPNSTDATKDVFSKAAFQVDGFEIYLGYNAGAGRHQIYYRTSQALANQTSATTASESLQVGVIQHVRVTRSGATALFYINDILVSKSENGTHIDPVANAARDLLIGKAPVNNAPLNGSLYLPRVYNAVVNSHFNQERHLFGV